MQHDTVKQPSVEDQLPHWRVIFEFETGAPNVMGVDVKGPTIIGRTVQALGIVADLDIGVYGAEAKGVSRKHAALVPDEDGVLLVDIGSTNGTFVNGERLSPGERERLRVGDVVRLSELDMTVKIITRLRDSHARAFKS